MAVCHWHGGKAPQVRAAAERRLQEWAAKEAVATFGLPREVDPQSALLEEVHRTAGHVAWLGALIRELDLQELKQYERSQANPDERFERPSVWLTIYQQERAHYVRVAKAAIDAGVEERRVRLAEAHGEIFGQVVRNILADVAALFLAAGVSSEVVKRLQREQVPDVVRKRFMEQAELMP